jgi:tetratricopeptide (TPR) repeat protein/TolB-like protein/tRNA A-37 threonylcarbamoyl transferase component Bud32
MTSPHADDWKRVRAVFEGALAQPAERRDSFVAESCRDEPAIHDHVVAMLASHDRAGAFLESPAGVLLGHRATAQVSATEDTDSNVGRVIGSYYIETCIGHGGMGTVYLARRADEAFERRVAIKMIRRGMDSDVLVRRFQHERQILASLDHPHIARLFDGGTTPEGLPYFVMEHVEGTPIDRYADAQRLSTRARIELCLPVLDAVQHAHDNHIVHRDLKPSNVLVAANGAPKLLDFGIAKILDPEAQGDSTLTTLARAMTPDYASPEQVRGEPVTPATDVYALGLLLYELLTGQRPFRLATRTPDEIMRIVCEEDPPKPSTAVGRGDRVAVTEGAASEEPEAVRETHEYARHLLRRQLTGALDAIVLKALRKEPAQRYPTAAALADDLRRYLSDRPVSAARDAVRYRVVRALRRHRTGTGVAALLVVAVAATAVLVRQPVPLSEDGVPAVTATQARSSVAIVPFRNLSGRAADEWLSTAVAEMLTTELVADGQLRVLPADAVARATREVTGTAGLGPDDVTYERLRTHLGADYLVAGSVVVADSSASRSLRLDLRVHRSEDDPIAVGGVGEEGRLFAVVADAGRGLRGRLGLREPSPDATSTARAAYPRTLEATRLYAEGLARLRQLDAVAARDLLERADAREPGNPLIQIALASAWTALGYDGRAADAAQRAFDASSGLNREDRLDVEGRLAEARQEWTKAIDVYRTLWGFFSDNAEYGLRLASMQTNAGEAGEALETLQTIRGLPPPQGQDPRIDLAEAQAVSELGNYKQELDAVQRVIRAAQSSGSRLLLARATLREGRTYRNLGQPGPAERSMRAAQAVFEEVGDKGGVASALNGLAALLGDQDDVAAERLFRQSLAISEEIGDRRAMSATLNNIGVILKDRREYDAARRVHERALVIRREVGNRNGEAGSLSNLGVVLYEQDRFAEAGRYYRESLAISREVGDQRGLVRALHNLAIVDKETGRLAEARKSFEESLPIRKQIGDRRGAVAGSVELGTVLLAQGEIARAREIQDEAAALAREIKLKPGEAQALYQLGQIALAAGDFALARTHHERALALRREVKETRTVAESETALAAVDLEEGRLADAERRAGATLRGLGPSPAGPLPVALRLLLARAALARRDLAGAEQLFGAAQRLAGKTERVDVRASLAMVEAELHAAQRRPAAARAALTALRGQLVPAQMTLADLDARLLLLRVSTGDQPSSQDAAARALETDARAKGAMLIVRRLQALR